MKNAKKIIRTPAFKLDRMQGAPPVVPRGWTLKYISGADEDFEQGFLLSLWTEDAKGTEFGFGPPDELITFEKEAVVISIATRLREAVGLETETLKVGG